MRSTTAIVREQGFAPLEADLRQDLTIADYRGRRAVVRKGRLRRRLSGLGLLGLAAPAGPAS